MEDIVRAAHDLQKFCDEHRWEFCFIGGIALQHWGRPRLTRDVDVCLLTGFGSEDSFVDSLLDEYVARVDHPREFALQNRVLLLKSRDGIGIDISLGGIPFEAQVVTRSSLVDYASDLRLRICSCEDFIVLKAFADRVQDWADVKSVLQTQDEVDWPYIDQQLCPLCEMKDAPEIVTKLNELKDATRS